MTVESRRARSKGVRRRVLTVRDGTVAEALDRLAPEEPLEVRLDGETVGVIMRTPGHDLELAVGWCLADGLLGPEDVASARFCAGVGPDGLQTYNVVDVGSRDGRRPGGLQRLATASSACGICGAASVEAATDQIGEAIRDDRTVTVDDLAEMAAAMRGAQATFDSTGGVHAAALFDLDGAMVCVREDVGRHNAVDKVVGWAQHDDRLPLSGHVLLVSGRVAFEIVHKAAIARIPIVAGVSAPTDLACTLAGTAGVTLVGFLRGRDANVYAHPERILLP